MDIINEFDDENEWELSILENGVNQCIDTYDFDQGLRLARKGLDIAFEINDEKWIDTFENFINFIKKQMEIMSEYVEQEPESIKGEKKNMQVEGNPTLRIDTKLNQIAKVKKSERELGMLQGIGPKTLEILISNGIDSIEQLASMTPRMLQSFKGIGMKSAEKYINVARNHMVQSNLTDYIEPPEMIIDNEVLPDNTSDYDKEISSNSNEIQQIDESNEKILMFDELDEIKEGNFYENDSKMNDNKIDEEFFSEFLHSSNDLLVQDGLISESIINDTPSKPISIKNTSITPLQAERLTREEIDKIIKNIENDLRSLDYWVLNKKIEQYLTLFKNIDLLAAKSIEISDFLELIIIIPIKISAGKGKHRIYEEKIQYVPENRKITLNMHDKRLLIESCFDAVKISRDQLFKDIINEGPLFHFLSKYLKKSLTIEKSLTKKELFLTTGEKYYEVLICPILIVDNEVEFLESSMAPFAWQRAENIHFIDSMNIKNFIAYIEKKHILIENHSTKENLIDGYITTYDKFFSRISYFAIPFVIYSGAIFLIALFAPSLLPTFIGLGVGMAMLLVLGIGFFVLSLLKNQSKLHAYFTTPYYERNLKIDESGIIMIKEELPEEWMHQFIYECDMNTKQFDTVRSFEIEEHIAHINGKQENEEKNEINSRGKIKFSPSMANKYSNFLED
ncbi:MAG: helix-hairpin-helix domain-containing protein [Promethearchaeota archaeon]